MKRFKKTISVLLAVLMIISALPLAASAEKAGAFDVTSADGSFSYANGRLTIKADGTYTIKNTDASKATNNRIYISNAVTDVVIKLEGVNIYGVDDDFCALEFAGVTDGMKAKVVLSGNNLLRSGKNMAGLQFGKKVDLTIDAETGGKLTAYSSGAGAGIGSGSQDECGNLTILGGDIVAGSNILDNGTGAGMGSGYSAKCGDINIIGGNIRAYSSQKGIGYGAGIGSGQRNASVGIVRISGGIVNAYASENGVSSATAIGCGNQGSKCDGVEISGGTVTALRSNSDEGSGQSIGRASGGTAATFGGLVITGGSVLAPHGAETATNGEGTAVYSNVLIVGEKPHQEKSALVTGGSVDGVACDVVADAKTGVYGIKDIYTYGSGELYLWLPASGSTEKEIVIEVGDNTYKGIFRRPADDTVIYTLGGGPAVKPEVPVYTKNVDGSYEIHKPGTIELELDSATIGTVPVLKGREAKEAGRYGEIIKKSVVNKKKIKFTVDIVGRVSIIDNSKSFEDVGSEWFASNVAFVSSRDLFQGVSDTKFAPDGRITRGMFVTVLWRLENEPAAKAKSPFTDVQNPLDYYYDAAAWAAENGIITGVAPDRFAPANNISREELAVMLYRYAKYLDLSTEVSGDLSKFKDANKVSSWAVIAMKWAVDAEIIRGNDDMLLPEGSATRAETAAMLQRFVEYIM